MFRITPLWWANRIESDPITAKFIESWAYHGSIKIASDVLRVPAARARRGCTWMAR
jgi:hypothetical protein